MSILKRILNKLKSKSDKLVINTQSEDEYYEQLFIHNNKWNKYSANQEEELRWNIIQEFIEQFVAKKNKSEAEISILDLGCGRGWLTNLLTPYGNVLGIEPVKKVVEYARSIFPSLNIKNGTSKDLLEQYSNSFDLIVSSEVIEHIPDHLKNDFVSDIRSLLKNSGYVIITTPRKEAQEEWNQYLGANQPVEDWISETELKELFHPMIFRELSHKRISIIPRENAPSLEIYQLWIFQKL